MTVSADSETHLPRLELRRETDDAWYYRVTVWLHHELGSVQVGKWTYTVGTRADYCGTEDYSVRAELWRAPPDTLLVVVREEQWNRYGSAPTHDTTHLHRSDAGGLSLRQVEGPVPAGAVCLEALERR
jgi:hypothetical protein